MEQKVKALVLQVILFQSLVIVLSKNDMLGLESLEHTPQNWKHNSDPCLTNWEGMKCNNMSSVISIKLLSMGLKGQLSDDTDKLSELTVLDLSFNKDLTGRLPESIGKLRKLEALALVGCSFSGQIPGTVGSLQNLIILSLNSNQFDGLIPPSIGNLSKLVWLDITRNNIEGPIPVSDGNTPGLNLLLNCRHFHLGKNRLTGPIPSQLFNSNMKLIHLLLDNNHLIGSIPSTVGLVQTLEVIDMSDNKFDDSDFPSWYYSLQSLQTLALKNIHLQGKIPSKLFSLPKLETVKLGDNNLNGALEISITETTHLKFIDLRQNSITEFKNGSKMGKVRITLVGNTLCGEPGIEQKYCNDSDSESEISYVTKRNCSPSASHCSSHQISSPKCVCAYPYIGNIVFVAPPFSDLGDTEFFTDVERYIMNFFQENSFLVDSISLSQPTKSEYLSIRIEIFPRDRDHFSQAEILDLGSSIMNLTYYAPKSFGAFSFYFMSDYMAYADKGKLNRSRTIGEAAGYSALVLFLLLAGMYVYFQRKRTERRTEQNKTLACCLSKKSNRRIPQLKGARLFSFKELKRYTNNFSPENEIGAGGYGKVYLGTLPTGEQIAVKRGKAKSNQSEAEFINEIELLSRVHHKNLVSLVGFCFEQHEQMLIYEYVPNGSLKDSLSGAPRIKLSWTNRIRVALDTAKGLTYLHEFANPPIIHRDIKSTNILLDDHLNAKVADFGLSKLLVNDEKDHVSTQVKGTAGYLDPEYYLTQQLTEKSDVYSFGVLMLELINARRPIERGRYIVKEVQTLMDKSKHLYNLQPVIDPAIGLEPKLNGFERFVELAMRCVENVGISRPTMSEVVKEIENILQLAHPKPNSDSTSASMSYKGSNETTSIHHYCEESLDQIVVFDHHQRMEQC